MIVRPSRKASWRAAVGVLLALGAAAAQSAKAQSPKAQSANAQTVNAQTATVQSAGAPLEVTVSEVWRPGGHVRVDVCTRDTFLRATCPYSGDAPARVGETTVTIRDVPPGTYALQVYHDVNDNPRVAQGFMGVPKEGVGFSRDPGLGMHGPSFESAEVIHGTAPQSLSGRLRHFCHHMPAAAPAQTAGE